MRGDNEDRTSFVDIYLAGEADEEDIQVHRKQATPATKRSSFDFDDYLAEDDNGDDDLEGLLPSSSNIAGNNHPSSFKKYVGLTILVGITTVMGFRGYQSYEHQHNPNVVVVNDDDFTFYTDQSDVSDSTSTPSSSSSGSNSNNQQSQSSQHTHIDATASDKVYMDQHHATEDDVGLALYHYGNLGNIWTEPYDDLTETPIYFHIPRSGGTTIEHVLGKCLNLIQASQVGAAIEDHKHQDDTQLEVLSTFGNEFLYVNVDTQSVEGLHHAKSLGLAESQMADVVYTEYIYDASDILFSSSHRGRLFCMMRHPVDRAVSMYYYLRQATWETTYDHTLQTYTLEEYAQKGQTEHNWMTRMLSNAGNGQLLVKHLDIAKAVLREKALVGLFDNFHDSIERFEQYFGWDDLLLQSQYGDIDPTLAQQHSSCQESLLQEKINAKHYEPLDENTETWNQLARRNWFDIELYEFSVELYHNQSKWFD